MKPLKRITALLLSAAIFAAVSLPVIADGGQTVDLELVRADDFEKFVPGAVCRGSTVYPTEGDAAGKGVPTEDGSAYLYDLAEDKSGGWGFGLSDGIEGNLVTTDGADGTSTKALQIRRPDKISVNNAKFVMQPTESFSAAKLVYSADMRNGGKAGTSAEDAGFTNRVNNYFGSFSVLGVTVDFNRQAVIFNANAKASPPVLTQESVEFAAPKNGEWFNFRAEVDALESTIAVYINDNKIGEKYYGGAFDSFTANALAISLGGSKDAENAFYLDNVRIEKSAMTADELRRVFEEETFKALGYPYVVYPGSAKYYFGDKVDYFSTDGSQQAMYVGSDVYLPIRTTASLYGYSTAWNGADRTITLSGAAGEVTIFANSASAVSGTEEISCKPIYMSDGASYIAAADVAAIFGKRIYNAPSGVAMLQDDTAPQPTQAQESRIVALYPDAALGFEIADSWFTYPDLVKAGGCEEYQLNINYGSNGRDNIGTSYQAQLRGVEYSTENVRSGRYSGLWKDHHFYPTIMTTNIPNDWSGYNAISVWIYSEVATGEHITIGAASNPYGMFDYAAYKINDKTLNFFYDEFVIDFTGWKQFVFPLEAMQSSGAVAGWGKVDALYFFTRAFDYEPLPQTVIYLDDIRLETYTESVSKEKAEETLDARAALEAAQEQALYKDFVLDVPDIFRDVSIPDYDKLLEAKKTLAKNPSDASALGTVEEIHQKYGITGDNYAYSDLVVHGKSKIYEQQIANGEELAFEKLNINHSFPETLSQPEKGEPIITWAYFKEARAMYGYNPKFFPTFTNIWGDFKFMVYASNVLEYADENGKWHFFDWSKQVERYAEEVLGFETYRLRTGGYYDETKVRFDNDGDAYRTIMIQGTRADGSGALYGVLCHSRDKMKTWDFYELSRPFTKMEILDGNNTDCLNRPPVIMLHNYWYSTDKSGAFVIPEKQADGTLVIPEETIYCAEDVICTSQHSGKANFAATVGNKVFMTFGICYDEQRLTERYNAALAYMPAGHSMKKLMEQQPDVFANPVGVPTFIIEYDIDTKTLSEPVFLGYAGKEYADGHNWSSLCVDSEGYLHAFLIGHHFPLVYCKSKKPADISEWEDVESIGAPVSISYASMNIDKNDTIYTITRDSTDGYHFDQVMYRKKKGGEWERIKMLKFWKGSYMIWGTDVYMDPETGALYINYRSKTSWLELFADDWAAKDFIFPDKSARLTDVAPVGVGYPYFPGHYANSGSEPRGEHVNVVTYDGGDTWRLATTEDYMPTKQ